jgi:hypothetical protein
VESANLLCPLLAFGVVVAILVTVRVTTRRREGRREGWPEFAARRGLEFDPKEKRITGVVDGLAVRLYVGPGLGPGGRAQGEHTVAETAVPELPRGFCMCTDRNVFHMIGATLAPVEGIDPNLQRLYLMRDVQQFPQVLAALKRPEVCDLLVRATLQHRLAIEEGGVRALTYGVVLNHGRLEKMLQVSLTVARALSKALAVSS